MRNGTETNKGFGPVVVVICGHTIVLVTQLVLRVQYLGLRLFACLREREAKGWSSNGLTVRVARRR